MKTEVRAGGPRDGWNTIGFGMLTVMTFSMMGSSACSPGSPGAGSSTRSVATPSDAPTAASPRASAAGPAGNSVPPPLMDAGTYGENVYDYAKANDWKNAEASLATLKTAVTQVRALVTTQSAVENRLDEDVAALERAVTARDRRAAMRVANQMTRDTADMTATYTPPVPVEVTRLDYDGRELEIWAEASDAEKLRATARAMRRDWDALRSTVTARSAAEAEKFGALIAQVEKAQTPAEFARLAKPVLDEVDNLEKVFHP